MPLPYAPPPKESKVYTDLKNLKITGVTVDQLDTLKGVLFAQGVDGSEDEMRRLKLIGEVSNQNSASGPIAGTQFVLDTTGITNSYISVYQPDAGTVYQLIAGNIITLDGAASMILNLEDSTTGNRVQIDTFNSTGNPLELNEPIYVTNEAFLSVRTSDASGGNARLATSLIRVR